MKNSGLLIVDLQIGFGPKPELVDRIQTAATDFNMIVMTRFTNPLGSLYRSVLNWNGDGGELALHLPRAIILDKIGYGLTASHLEVLCGCTEWHICGMETDACVLACAFSLWDAGLRPVIRPELCDSPLHNEWITVATRQFGKYSAQSE
jgi:nicotinamidase-related amidase